MFNALDTLAAGEVSDSTFLIYVGALTLSGIILFVVSALPIGTPILNRVINVVVGVAMLGYAFYLLFLFEGGEFRMFLYAFLAPIFAIVSTVKAAKAARVGVK